MVSWLLQPLWSSITPKTPQRPNIAELNFDMYASREDLIEDVIQSLKESGGCLIRGMYSQDALNAMGSEIRPYITATQKAESKREDFVPSSTRMVTGLLSKSRTYALSVAGNMVWQDVSKHFLTSTLSNSWVSRYGSSSIPGMAYILV